MSNKLKKFIWDNRAAFDDEVPSEKVWQHMEDAFTPTKKNSFLHLYINGVWRLQPC